MGYLKFDNFTLADLGQSLQKEIIIPNKLGAYYSTTSVGCNTRKYHGAFVVPSNIEGKEKLLLISSIDETLVQNTAEYNFGTHEYTAGYFSPNGQNYMRLFDYNSNSVTITYRAGGTLVEKCVALCENENRLIVRYKILKGNSSIKIEPLLAFRDTSELCVENDSVHKEYKAISNGIALSLYEKYPVLNMQLSKKSDFVATGYWKKNIEYFNERDRGYHDREDLYVAGHFIVEAKEGDVIYFTAGLSESKAKDIESSFNSLIKKESADTMETVLLQTARNMFVEKDGRSYMMAGYPWYKCIARNMVIAIPGLISAGSTPKEIDICLDTVGSEIEKMMSESKEKNYDPNITGIEQPDVVLWYVKAIQDYAATFGKNAAKKKYADKLIRIVDFIKSGKHVNIELTYNGLLYIHGWEKPMTWMNSVGVDGKPITPRSGWAVEINALWYNALKFTAELTENNTYDQLADNVGDNFVSIFWNGSYLFDFVDGDHFERSVRPNMIWAVALKYSPLNGDQQKAVVDMETKELLTPKGIRSLSPYSNNFHWNGAGGQQGRDYAAFQGAVYPWLMGAYIESYLRVYKQSGYSFAEKSMHGLEDEMFNNTIGTYSEMYDGMAPYKSSEGMSYGINVCEVIRAKHLLSKLEAE